MIIIIWLGQILVFFSINLDFPKNSQLTLPIFNLVTNNYTGENIVLEHDIFNQIVRKDIIHKVMVYNREYNHRTYKWVKSKGDVAGSNKKPFQQKKTGRTPQGDKRAPNLYHGGKAHGAKPRSFYFPLNKKIRLMGLKCMLSVKLIENKILILDSEQIESENITKLKEAFRFLKNNRTLFVTSKALDKDYETQINKMECIEIITPEVKLSLKLET